MGCAKNFSKEQYNENIVELVAKLTPFGFYNSSTRMNRYYSNIQMYYVH